MTPKQPDVREMTRRHFFEQVFGKVAGISLGSVALATLLEENGYAQTAAPFITRVPKAKRVVYLQMAGGAPHVDLFDYKPQLRKFDGIDAPESLYQGSTVCLYHRRSQNGGVAFYIQAVRTVRRVVLGSVAQPVQARRRSHVPEGNGDDAVQPRSGADLHDDRSSDFRPAGIRFLALLRHRQREQGPPGLRGAAVGQFEPAMGEPRAGEAAFCPTVHQGVPFQKRGDPINFVSNPRESPADTRRRSIDLINRLNEANLEVAGDPETLTRIQQYELAYKMQTSVPELTDISKERPEVLEKYGAVPGEASYGKNALLARRLLEHGVRFVHLIHRNWDMHGGSAQARRLQQVPGELPAGRWSHGRVDYGSQGTRNVRRHAHHLGVRVRPHADETRHSGWHDRAVFWARPSSQGYTIWMAGGGLKPGMTYGATDEWGYWAVEGKTQSPRCIRHDP